MNWGTIGGWAGAVLAAASSIGYFMSGDIRRGIYFALCSAIGVTVIWPS